MPTSNHGRPQSVRRPRVAGLRRPSPGPRPETEERSDGPEIAESLFTPAPKKPSPRAKHRDSGKPKPADFFEAETEVAHDEPEPRVRVRRPRNPYVIAGALFGLAVVLAGFAVFFKIKDNEISAATDNTALLDAGRTAQVNQAATNAAATLFSYDYNDIAKTQNAAKDLLLNDDVRAKYNSLMGQVERLAPQQKIVVTVKASRSAVIMLNGDTARVMVFVDQTATRTDQNQTSSGSAQLWMNMKYVDGKWKVNAMDTYNSQPAASTAPAPSSQPSAPRPSR
ncbi:hypothetical protein [Amycolatopsis alkalitolerans]|uniref:Mce-associated membrane protein n=1 Tax=Amycolatopsis alkalitolerans TaxID=2547244 RepID=A0A5C4M716_9PSEU|nr:hypothetical protein [Amycolatopsis alkalitolerans]TNC28671.1 hypothetical protein FG385_05320 [Amycolatopsis alkalitolerans]